MSHLPACEIIFPGACREILILRCINHAKKTA
jgi:hypothetical protein